jgi:two-component system response regulator YesN
MIRAYLLEIFILLIRKVAEAIDIKGVSLEGKEAVDKARDFIRSHFQEPLDLDRISGHVCLSSSHFSRLFKIETNFSPVEYLNYIRIEEAKRLLIYSDLTLTEIANRVGLNSIHYFSHKFKKKEGIGPLDFRREKKRLLFYKSR